MWTVILIGTEANKQEFWQTFSERRIMKIRITGVIIQFKDGYITYEEMRDYLIICFSEIETPEELFTALGWAKEALDISKGI